ncbi:DUF547 domain-containing protein [Pseudoalteromonas sp. S327]|nr:DUF547 domain-containing protein [Pseudoalteromonas sp. S327]TMO14029.1 DUF547 domain-containing protein [Pseudoalteromonas sp. S326]HAG40551.1 DUF547 domain-containing protein [Pseudoalteromonas sp.]
MRLSLENVPVQGSLNDLSLDEQRAYWLNLYNIAMIEKLIQWTSHSAVQCAGAVNGSYLASFFQRK